MKHCWLLIFIFLFFNTTSWAQSRKYEVAFSHIPLNEALTQLRDQYDWQYSFDDQLLSRFSITIEGSFTKKEALMDALLKGLPLDYELHGNIFVIFPIKKEPRPWQLTGLVVEVGTAEPLPFSHVVINGQGTTTDFKGAFSFSSLTDSVFHIKASHLGCYVLDTTLNPGLGQRILLTPSTVGLPEITVRENLVEKSAQFGEAPGLIKLNPYIAHFLPGNGDNSVFNLLRLQPGILAAGEQTNDLTIWGCAEGTSRLKFDGFTIWGLNNFSDQIGAVNPYLAKNINIMKGGYDASNDDITGGIVVITGINGNTNKAGFNLYLNNQTVNGMIELPIQKKSALVLAFRQTYHNLFDASDFGKTSTRFPTSGNQPYSIKPDYTFRDLNLKYSVQGENGDLFYFSALASDDHFQYQYRQDWGAYALNQENMEENIQLGGTAFFGKNWDNGSRTNFKTSYSTLMSTYDRYRYIERLRNNRRINRIDDHANTDVAEWSGEVEHVMPLSAKHLLNMGVKLVRNDVVLREDTFDVQTIDLSQQANRLTLFSQDEITLTPQMKLKAGARLNYPFNLNKLYVDPRLSLNIRTNNQWKFNLAWGLYHQFLMKSSVVDEEGNYRYNWAIANASTVPVIKAHHYVGGAAFSHGNFTASLEAYYKDARGMTRFFKLSRLEYLLEGKNRSYGLDFFVKQDFNHHAIWVAYSLGKTEELFYRVIGNEVLSNNLQPKYRRAPQDQRHEIKVAGLFNLRNWHLSASYVYGSGLPLYTNYRLETYTEPDYHRVDAALIYKLSRQRFTGEIGLSVLNLFDAANIKYASFVKVPIDQLNTVYINTEPVGFTPLLYVKLGF